MKRIKKLALIGAIAIPVTLGVGQNAKAQDFFGSVISGFGEEVGGIGGGIFRGAFTAVTGFETPQLFAQDMFSSILGKEKLDLPIASNVEEHVGELGSVDLQSAAEASQDSLQGLIEDNTGIMSNMAAKAQGQSFQRAAIQASAQNTLSQEAQTAARSSIESTGETNAKQAEALSDVMQFTVTQDIAKYQAVLNQAQNNILGDIKAGQITSAQSDAQTNQLLSNIDGSLAEIKNQGSDSNAGAIASLSASKGALNLF
ncbi:hypothetical protein [Acaryochloris thomasi]|nr:hypothetical protein [Acaryochloris thomasi]